MPARLKRVPDEQVVNCRKVAFLDRKAPRIKGVESLILHFGSGKAFSVVHGGVLDFLCFAVTSDVRGGHLPAHGRCVTKPKWQIAVPEPCCRAWNFREINRWADQRGSNQCTLGDDRGFGLFDKIKLCLEGPRSNACRP